MVQLEREKHWVRETDAVRFLRRELNDPDLITFWNAQVGHWTLAYWIDKGKGVVEDVRRLGKSYDAGPQLTPELVHSMKATNKPTDFKRLRKSLLEHHKAELRARDDKNREDRDQRAWLRKHGSDGVYFGGNPI